MHMWVRTSQTLKNVIKPIYSEHSWKSLLISKESCPFDVCCNSKQGNIWHQTYLSTPPILIFPSVASLFASALKLVAQGDPPYQHSTEAPVPDSPEPEKKKKKRNASKGGVTLSSSGKGGVTSPGEAIGTPSGGVSWEMSDEWSFIHQIRQGALLRVSFKEYCINCIQFSRMIIAIVRISVSVSLLITKLLQWSSPLRCSSLGSGAWQSCRMQTNAFVDFLFACSCTAVGLMDCEALASSSNFHQKNDLPHATSTELRCSSQIWVTASHASPRGCQPRPVPLFIHHGIGSGDGARESWNQTCQKCMPPYTPGSRREKRLFKGHAGHWSDHIQLCIFLDLYIIYTLHITACIIKFWQYQHISTKLGDPPSCDQ